MGYPKSPASTGKLVIEVELDWKAPEPREYWLLRAFALRLQHLHRIDGNGRKKVKDRTGRTICTMRIIEDASVNVFD